MSLCDIHRCKEASWKRPNSLFNMEFHKEEVEYKYFVVASPQQNKDSSISSRSSVSPTASPYLHNSMHEQHVMSPQITSFTDITSLSHHQLELRKQELWEEICKIDVALMNLEKSRSLVEEMREKMTACKTAYYGVVDSSEVKKESKVKMKENKSTNKGGRKLTLIENVRDCCNYYLEQSAGQDFQHAEALKRGVTKLRRACTETLESNATTCSEVAYELGRVCGLLECVWESVFVEEISPIKEPAHDTSAPESLNESETITSTQNESITSTQNESISIPDNKSVTSPKILHSTFDRANNNTNDVTDFNVSSVSIEEAKSAQARLKKIKATLEKVERLSSGAPKFKSLLSNFELSISILKRLDAECLSVPARSNLVRLRKHLNREKPSSGDLELAFSLLGGLASTLEFVK